MIKKLLTVAALTLVLTSCTADKFEQIDANFALLVEENERINDAIDSNSDDITSLEEALDDAVAYLKNLVEDASEALTTVIDTLSEDTTNVLNQLMDADEVLANDLQTASDSLTDAIAAVQAQVSTNVSTINLALTNQSIINNEQAADLLALEIALETAEGDAAANLEAAISALEAEMNIEFAEFSVDINTLLAGVPSQVRAEVAEALLAISFNASNVLEITVVNPTDELNALEANVVALQLQITQLLAAGSGTAVAISSTQNSDGSVTLMVGDNVYTIPAGSPGAAGLQGIAGQRGIQGIRGMQGAIGIGTTGADGAIGAPGDDGTVVTVIEGSDNKLSITIDGVVYVIRESEQVAWTTADWGQSWLLQPSGEFWSLTSLEASAGTVAERYEIRDFGQTPPQFRVSFIVVGPTVLGSYNSFDEANAAAYAHFVANN